MVAVEIRASAAVVEGNAGSCIGAWDGFFFGWVEFVGSNWRFRYRGFGLGHTICALGHAPTGGTGVSH